MLKTIGRVLREQLVHLQRERMRGELLTLSDHALQDAGFSRELLLEGVRAWPWQATDEESLAPLDLSALDVRWVRELPAGKTQDQSLAA